MKCGNAITAVISPSKHRIPAAGVQSSKLQKHIEGAPNFRGVPGQQVHGSAMPTLEGMKRVLDHVGCGPTSTPASGQVSHHAPKCIHC